MEDAVRALKMAFAVFVFVFALSIAFYVLSLARTTGEIVVFTSDKTNYYDNVKSDTSETKRIVGLETVIPTLYRYYRENFAVQILDKDGNVLQLFDTTTEWELSNAAKVVKNRRNARQNTLMNLYGNKSDDKCMWGAPWVGTTDEDAKARIDLYIKGGKAYINNALVDYKDRGLLDHFNADSHFYETFTEYQLSGNYITEVDGEKLDEDERLVDDNQGSKKILITYKEKRVE